MAKTNPLQFLQQVRSETNKVTWPTRRETIITAIMVVIFVIVMAVFFSIADTLLTAGVGLILNLGQ